MLREIASRSTLFAMMPRRLWFACVILFVLAIGGMLFAQAGSSKTKSGVQQKAFGTREGRPVNLYTLTNSHGVEVHAMNYGGIILSIRVPDRKGQFADIVLGHDTLEGYIAESSVHWRDRRTLRQPHRQWDLHARWQDLHACQKRRAEYPARRHDEDFQQSRVGCRAAERQDWRRFHLPQQRRRGRLSRQPESDR